MRAVVVGAGRSTGTPEGWNRSVTRLGRARHVSEGMKNSALVTKTLVFNGSSAMCERKPIQIADFLDLSALCEATVLLDEMQVLESPDKLDSHFAQKLRQSEILTEFAPKLTRDELRRVVAHLPTPLRRQTSTSFFDDLNASYPSGPRYDLREPFAIGAGGELQGVDYDTELDSILRALETVKRKTSMPIDARFDARDRLFRSNAYLVVAAANKLDYFPDFDRAPFAATWVAASYRSLPYELYRRVAESLGLDGENNTELVREWGCAFDLPIPPVTAIVLHRAGRPEEIPQRLMEARDEFASYRRHFRSFKLDLQDADSFDKRRKLRAKYRKLLTTASGASPDLLTASEVLNFGEKLAAVAAAPSSPNVYSATLLLQPIEWIRRWWLQRPLSILFRMDKSLPRLQEYRALVAKHWGEAAADTITSSYAEHAHQLSRAFEASRFITLPKKR